jgi:hypothetical protein
MCARVPNRLRFSSGNMLMRFVDDAAAKPGGELTGTICRTNWGGLIRAYAMGFWIGYMCGRERRRPRLAPTMEVFINIAGTTRQSIVDREWNAAANSFGAGLQRADKSLKGERIRPGTPLSLGHARCPVEATSNVTTTSA